MVFALDVSGSVSEVNYQSVIAFVQETVAKLPIGDDAKIGLLTYGDSPKVSFYPGMGSKYHEMRLL